MPSGLYWNTVKEYWCKNLVILCFFFSGMISYRWLDFQPVVQNYKLAFTNSFKSWKFSEPVFGYIYAIRTTWKHNEVHFKDFEMLSFWAQFGPETTMTRMCFSPPWQKWKKSLQFFGTFLKQYKSRFWKITSVWFI